jgi:hypothetical protein
VWAAEALLGEPALEVAGEARGGRLGGLGRGAREAGHVQRDDPALAHQRLPHGGPHAAVAAEPVQEHERRPGAVAVEGERHAGGSVLARGCSTVDNKICVSGLVAAQCAR